MIFVVFHEPNMNEHDIAIAPSWFCVPPDKALELCCDPNGEIEFLEMTAAKRVVFGSFSFGLIGMKACRNESRCFMRGARGFASVWPDGVFSTNNMLAI